jgi:hypothetical protein
MAIAYVDLVRTRVKGTPLDVVLDREYRYGVKSIGILEIEVSHIVTRAYARAGYPCVATLQSIVNQPDIRADLSTDANL